MISIQQHLHFMCSVCYSVCVDTRMPHELWITSPLDSQLSKSATLAFHVQGTESFQKSLTADILKCEPWNARPAAATEPPSNICTVFQKGFIFSRHRCVNRFTQIVNHNCSAWCCCWVASRPKVTDNMCILWLRHFDQFDAIKHKCITTRTVNNTAEQSCRYWKPFGNI